MWILKNSKDLLEHIHASSLSCSIINISDFSNLYTTLKTKDRLTELIRLCFIRQNGQRRYKYFVLGRDKSYFIINTL